MAGLAPREAGGAHSPEELKILLEDACIVRDGWAAAALFEHDAVLAVSGTAEARGEEEIARTSFTLWAHGGVYVAVPARVVQAGDVALSIGGGISVMRRGADRCWRYAICVPASNAKEQP